MKKYLLTFLALCHSAYAQSINDLEQYFQETQTLEADFVQRVGKANKTKQSSGQMALKKPHYFLWDYQKPSVQQIAGDGKKVYHYDADLQQMTIHQPEQLIGNVALTLLSSDKPLRQNFFISTTESAPFLSQNAAGSVIFRLTPTVSQSEYKALWVSFAGKELQKVLIDNGDSFSELSFDNIKRNQPISEKRFVLNVPKGTDIVGE